MSQDKTSPLPHREGRRVAESPSGGVEQLVPFLRVPRPLGGQTLFTHSECPKAWGYGATPALGHRVAGASWSHPDLGRELVVWGLNATLHLGENVEIVNIKG